MVLKLYFPISVSLVISLLKIGTGLNKSAVVTASQIRIAITGVLKVKRLKLYPNSVYGRKGGSAIFGGFYT